MRTIFVMLFYIVIFILAFIINHVNGQIDSHINDWGKLESLCNENNGKYKHLCNKKNGEILFSVVDFIPGKASVSKGQKKIIMRVFDEITSYLNQNKEGQSSDIVKRGVMCIVIYGHTDHYEHKEGNLYLSYERAINVLQVLQKELIDDKRDFKHHFEVKGFSDTNPFDNTENQKNNRRSVLSAFHMAETYRDLWGLSYE